MIVDLLGEPKFRRKMKIKDLFFCPSLNPIQHSATGLIHLLLLSRIQKCTLVTRTGQEEVCLLSGVQKGNQIPTLSKLSFLRPVLPQSFLSKSFPSQKGQDSERGRVREIVSRDKTDKGRRGTCPSQTESSTICLSLPSIILLPILSSHELEDPSAVSPDRLVQGCSVFDPSESEKNPVTAP